MLHEQYRPRTFAEFAGNQSVVARLQKMLNRPSFTGGALWIDGPSGSGKTTLAKIVAAHLANDFDVEELDGERCTVEAVRALSDSIAISPMFGSWKVIIVNESHAMTPRAVQAWLTLLERLPPNRLVIFTTTETGELFGNFTQPMLSRCVHFSLSADGVAFAERARHVANLEGMDAPGVDYVELVKQCGGNMRRVIGRIESGDLPDSSVVAKPKKLSALEEMKQRYKIA